MDLKTAAARLKVGETDLRRMAMRGVVPARKVDSQLWFNREDIERAWAQRESKRAPASGLLHKTQIMPVMPLVANLLTPRRVKLDLRAVARDGVLRELVGLVIEPHEKRSAEALFAALKAREELCPTCVNEGVAIPHARNAIVGLVDRVVIAYGRSRRGVDFGALDGQPVHHFFLLCAPNVRDHLHVLAQLARLMRNAKLVAQLMDGQTTAAVITAIREAERALLR